MSKSIFLTLLNNMPCLENELYAHHIICTDQCYEHANHTWRETWAKDDDELSRRNPSKGKRPTNDDAITRDGALNYSTNPKFHDVPGFPKQERWSRESSTSTLVGRRGRGCECGRGRGYRYG